MDTILTVVDLNVGTQKVIAETRKYAEALKANVVLVNIEPLLPGAEGATAEELTKDLQDNFGEEIQTIHDHGEALNASGIQTRVLVIEGTEAEQLLLEAERENASLIVIASYPHGGLVEALTHGLREQLAKHAHCPVLMVPLK